MKLHRLTLTNYRGIAHREIEFPDHGVVVVYGANEIGKSSMIEALDLLLESKDRSTRKDVKQVKPANADVGSEVTAEISSGPYRFVYRKRFHKKCETELTVLAPRRAQLTGDEAHERVRTMLAETVDTELWRAQRVLQASSTAAVDLSDCDALSRALDIAASQSVGDAASSGTEPLLIERIDAEYARYFTATGRPTGEWSAAQARLDAAKAAVAECASAMAEVDDRVHRHTELTRQSAELAQQCVAIGPRLAAAVAAADQVKVLTDEVREARLIAAAASATSTASTAAHAGRLALISEIDSRAALIAKSVAQAEDAAGHQAVAAREATACDAAAQEAVALLAAAHDRTEAARRALDRIAEREEADRLSARLARIDGIRRDLDPINQELSALVLTDEMLRRIEQAAASVDRAGDQLEMVSAVLEFTATADIELVVGAERVALPAGQSWAVTATGPTDVEVAGVLTTRVVPGATALDVRARYVAAQQELNAALEAAGVADVAAARSAGRRREELRSNRDRLTATLAGLCGEEDADQLRARVAQLQANQPAEPDLFAGDTASARAERDEAESARVAAQAECESRRQLAAAASRRLADAATRTAILTNDAAIQRAELDAAVTRLAGERASLGDEALAATADTERQAAHAAELRVAELNRALAAAKPDTIAAELAEAQKIAETVRERRDAANAALKEISIELAVLRSEGRKGRLDAAETELEHATSQHTRVGDRARAAQLLRSVMCRHRDDTRKRYVEPYRAELQRLGRPVFGPTFEIDIDSDLRILNRTLAGVTVSYESLSGGAKEQLGILARLAGAGLVAKEDAVPVVVDDALGFTDPDRLAKMGEVFDSVGAHGQVIVLTCSPSRYDGVTGAHRIDLNA
ncbi:AAA family ATPase [Mycobacterium camsae]|uniref:AAA family ATPase n=1 Tax=Mycobacterium gordonae TaxID=1778 RepID=UPI00197FD925|nr:AAA family ATPase [Mycobacterium gordonae]